MELQNFEGKSSSTELGHPSSFIEKQRKGKSRNRHQVPGNEAGSTESQVGIGISPAPGTLLFFKLSILFWSIVDYQCCDSFRCTAK